MISVVIPAYNEEDRIEQTLIDYSKGLATKGPYEIIVVCDGSRDRTAEIAARYARVLQFPQRLGKGGGVIEGFRAAKGDVVGFTDADNSLKVDQFLRLLDEMDRTGAGCVIADRKSKEAMIMESQYLVRRMASESFNFLFSRALFGLRSTGLAVRRQGLQEGVHRSGPAAARMHRLRVRRGAVLAADEDRLRDQVRCR